MQPFVGLFGINTSPRASTSAFTSLATTNMTWEQSGIPEARCPPVAAALYRTPLFPTVNSLNVSMPDSRLSSLRSDKKRSDDVGGVMIGTQPRARTRDNVHAAVVDEGGRME